MKTELFEAYCPEYLILLLIYAMFKNPHYYFIHFGFGFGFVVLKKYYLILLTKYSINHLKVEKYFLVLSQLDGLEYFVVYIDQFKYVLDMLDIIKDETLQLFPKMLAVYKSGILLERYYLTQITFNK